MKVKSFIVSLIVSLTALAYAQSPGFYSDTESGKHIEGTLQLAGAEVVDCTSELVSNMAGTNVEDYECFYVPGSNSDFRNMVTALANASEFVVDSFGWSPQGGGMATATEYRDGYTAIWMLNDNGYGIVMGGNV